MAALHTHRYFKHIADDWRLFTDCGSQYVTSLLTCAAMCLYLNKCVTINILPVGTLYTCQMSKKKATCMEKAEAARCAGARMYQTKVTFILICGEGKVNRQPNQTSRFLTLFTLLEALCTELFRSALFSQKQLIKQPVETGRSSIKFL